MDEEVESKEFNIDGWKEVKDGCGDRQMEIDI